jgi:hypothetical protein
MDEGRTQNQRNSTQDEGGGGNEAAGASLLDVPNLTTFGQSIQLLQVSRMAESNLSFRSRRQRRSWCYRIIGVRTDQEEVREGPEGREACIA